VTDLSFEAIVLDFSKKGNELSVCDDKTDAYGPLVIGFSKSFPLNENTTRFEVSSCRITCIAGSFINCEDIESRV
jgi:predicted metallo-beta-lactamase superfamily hydrolase